jgi:hypothetical protein
VESCFKNGHLETVFFGFLDIHFFEVSEKNEKQVIILIVV